jgi:hypothetical protein
LAAERPEEPMHCTVLAHDGVAPTLGAKQTATEVDHVVLPGEQVGEEVDGDHADHSRVTFSSVERVPCPGAQTHHHRLADTSIIANVRERVVHIFRHGLLDGGGNLAPL